MRAKPHPEQGFRSCLGILSLARSYGPVRLEAACRRGVVIGAASYRSIASILKTGLDKAFLPDSEPDAVSHPSRQDRLVLERDDRDECRHGEDDVDIEDRFSNSACRSASHRSRARPGTWGGAGRVSCFVGDATHDAVIALLDMAAEKVAVRQA